MLPWEQPFSWGVFWAVVAALLAWNLLKWIAIWGLALVSHAIDNW
jgi:hypothetical protein